MREDLLSLLRVVELLLKGERWEANRELVLLKKRMEPPAEEAQPKP